MEFCNGRDVFLGAFVMAFVTFLQLVKFLS